MFGVRSQVIKILHGKKKRPLERVPRAVYRLKSLQSIGDAYKVVHGMAMLDEHSKGFSEDSPKLVSLEPDELPISDDSGFSPHESILNPVAGKELVYTIY